MACAQRTTQHMVVARTSNTRVIVPRDLCCFLLPQYEACALAARVSDRNRTCVPNLSCDYFSESCSAKGKIASAVILPHNAE